MGPGGRTGRTNSEGGFTLIELLVAMMVTMIGLTGLLSLQTSVMQGSQAASQFGEANGFARAAMEELRSMSVSELETRYGTLPVNGLVLDTVSGRAGQSYTRTIGIEESTPSSDLVRMTVIVSWTEEGAIPGSDGGRYDHSVRLELLRTRKEAL
jgi:prepilin-type N-terminal cleavage/methylation domain-containing protein